MKYERPPIAECVLEFRFQTPFSEKRINQIANKLKKHYPVSEDRINVSTELNAEGVANATSKKVGYELRSTSSLEVVRIEGASFLLSELAPYSGWENFRDRSLRDYSIFRDIVGPLEIIRIGLRYVNRIDVKIVEGKPLLFKDYLQIAPQMPNIGPPSLTEYSSRITKPSGVEGISITVTSGTIESPLAEHRSLLVDIDVFNEIKLANNLKKVRELLEKYRVIKNEVFEVIITDECRNLFGAID